MQNTIAAESFPLSYVFAACGKLIRVAAAHWLHFLSALRRNQPLKTENSFELAFSPASPIPLCYFPLPIFQDPVLSISGVIPPLEFVVFCVQERVLNVVSGWT